ncbi:MAG: hypothetical protein IJ379_12375 [Lachnospiraceae bacterium]|nr:hypothetical protein [Lachnospiraceae bacterium]
MTHYLVTNIVKVAAYIRFDIRNINNKACLELIMLAIEGKITNLQFGQQISTLYKIILQSETEEDEQVPKTIEDMVTRLCEALQSALNDCNYEFAYDIADIIQAIPDREYWYDKSSMKSWQKIYIRPVEKKWRVDL